MLYSTSMTRMKVISENNGVLICVFEYITCEGKRAVLPVVNILG